MEKNRTLKNLILEDEDYIFGGSLTITGDLNLKNCSIIIAGQLMVMGQITITGGDIVCEHLDCENIFIRDGDICVKILSSNDIDSDGNIEVSKYVYYAGSVKAFNYLIAGDNDCCSINVTQDLYILGNNDSHDITAREVFISGDNDSYDITAREIFIGGNCDLSFGNINSKSFVCMKQLIDCGSININ